MPRPRKRMRPMFPKRKYKASARSRVRARPRIARTIGTTLGRSAGFPTKLVFKHKYCEDVQISATAAGVGYFRFRANGMYDPNASGAGHQPSYYDQVSSIYNHWVVVGSKLTYRVTPVGTTIQPPSKLVCYHNDDNSSANSISAVCESRGSRAHMLTGDPSEKVFGTLKYSAKKTFGGSVLANALLRGQVGNDPSEESYYFFIIQAYGGDTSTVSYYISVTIEYTAVWFELKDLVES